MKVLVIKQFDHSLKPAFDSDLEKMKKLKVGELYEIEYKKPRNILHHRKFFGLLNVVFENQEIYNNIDIMREELTKACGEYDTYTNHKGIECYKAKSLSFASMCQVDFDLFYSKFLDVVITIFKFDRELFEQELESFY